MPDPDHVYLLVKVLRGTQPGESQLSWPPSWDAGRAELARAGPALYDHGVMARGLDEEHVLWKVRRWFAEECVAVDPTRYSMFGEATGTGLFRIAAKLARLTETDAQGVPTSVTVTDPALASILEAKARLAWAGHPVEVTTADLDALDPDKSTRGLNRFPRTAQAFFGGPSVTFDEKA